jgi:dienelactone hydrolase
MPKISTPFKGKHFSIAAVAIVALLSSACTVSLSSTPPPAPYAPVSPERSAALDAAIDSPAPETYRMQLFDWVDTARTRDVRVKLYLPTDGRDLPMTVVSHGIGGSREGYSYIGKFLAANGIASLHVQHPGSDRALWFGNPLMLVARLHSAASEIEVLDRARDVTFALDQMLADEALRARIDPARIAITGHSYGANTAMLIAGARIVRGNGVLALSDPRIKAAVMISAPPFTGEGDQHAILGDIQIPTLHITATGDDITIPGYRSDVKDRLDVFEATAARSLATKSLAVFKEGSHSMFTDRLFTGGEALNPKVKRATREVVLHFLRDALTQPKGEAGGFTAWAARHGEILMQTQQR